MKPIPTLIKPLGTADLETGESQPTRYERSDVTSVPAASTVAEATVAWEIAVALLERYAECERSGEWPGYPDEVRDISIPEWAWYQMDDQTAGLEVE